MGTWLNPPPFVIMFWHVVCPLWRRLNNTFIYRVHHMTSSWHDCIIILLDSTLTVQGASAGVKHALHQLTATVSFSHNCQVSYLGSIATYMLVIVFCVGASKAPPVLYLSYSTGRRYLCSLRYILCIYAYNKLMAWEGVLYADYSTQDRVSRTIQHSASPCAVLNFVIMTCL